MKRQQTTVLRENEKLMKRLEELAGMIDQIQYRREGVDQQNQNLSQLQPDLSQLSVPQSNLLLQQLLQQIKLIRQKVLIQHSFQQDLLQTQQSLQKYSESLSQTISELRSKKSPYKASLNKKQMEVPEEFTLPYGSQRMRFLDQNATIDDVIADLKRKVSKQLPKEVEMLVPPNILILNSGQTFLIVGSTNGTISLYQTSSLLLQSEVQKSTSAITSLCLVQNQQYLVSGDATGNLYVFSFPKLQVVNYIQFQGSNLIIRLNYHYNVLVSSEKKFLYSLNVMDVFNYEQIQMNEKVICMDNAKNTLAVGFNTGIVLVLNPFDYGQRAKLGETEENSVTIVKIHQKELFVAAAYSNFTVKVWNQYMSQIYYFNLHTDLVTGISFIKEEPFLLTSSKDSNIMLFNLDKKRSTFKFNYYDSPANYVFCGQQNQFIYIAYKNNKLLVWEFPELSKDVRLRDHEAPITCLQFFKKQDSLITADQQGTLIIWDLINQQIRKKKEFNSIIKQISVSPCQTYVLVSTKQPSFCMLKLQDMSIFQIKNKYIVNSIEFLSTGNQVISGDNLNRVLIWTFPQMKKFMTLKGHYKEITGLAVIQNRKEVISVSKDSTMRSWCLNSGNNNQKYIGHTAAITSVKLKDNGHVAVTSSLDMSILMWDIQKGVILYSIFHDSPVQGILTIQSEDHLISITAQQVFFWDLRVLQMMTSLNPKKKITHIAAHDNLLAIIQEKVVYIRVNPLQSEQFAVVGYDKNSQYRFMRYVDKLLNQDFSLQHRQQYNHWMFSPSQLNIVHILTYMNCRARLKQCLKNKYQSGKLTMTQNNNSPIGIAVEKGYIECINLLIKEMATQSEEGVKSLAPLESCLYQLNSLDVDYLPILYKKLLRVSDDLSLPKFCYGKLNFPIFYYNEHQVMMAQNFNLQSEDKTFSQQIQFISAILPLSLNIGSERSIQFLRSLLKAPQSDIFTSQFIAKLLQDK